MSEIIINTAVLNFNVNNEDKDSKIQLIDSNTFLVDPVRYLTQEC